MRLLLIEDDEVIARELCLRWQRWGWDFDAVTTLGAADERMAQGGIDIVVLDLGLPDGDGMNWLVKLRQHERSLPVLVLTARDLVSERVRGLRMGADDYLVKPFAVDELDARIEVLSRRARVLQSERCQFGALVWMGQEGSAYVDRRRLDLSPREFEVLGLLIQRAPRLVPKRTLIDTLAERNLDMGDSAAEVYISRLRRKLEGSGTAIRTMRGFGYLLELKAGQAAPDPAGS
jgi:two-component system response regulator TctD